MSVCLVHKVILLVNHKNWPKIKGKGGINRRQLRACAQEKMGVGAIWQFGFQNCSDWGLQLAWILTSPIPRYSPQVALLTFRYMSPLVCLLFQVLG
jgi:hypothetical protein